MRRQHRRERPAPQWADTVAFYRDTLGMGTIPHESDVPNSVGVVWGAITLWIGKAPALRQTEVWFELVTHEPSAAEALADAGVPRCDDIEPVPDGVSGFWIASPASVVHFVSTPGPAAVR